MSDYIKKRQYKRYLVCQPYFVWHSLVDQKNLDELEDEDDLVDLMWGDEVQEESLEETADQKIVRTFRLIDEHLMSELKKAREVVFLNSKDPIETRIAQTKELLNSGKIIIKPAFIYRNAVSTPFAFDTRDQTIINVKYSMKFKNKDFIDFYYDYQIVSKNIEVKDCLMYLPRDKDYKRNEIDLFVLNASTTKADSAQTEMDKMVNFLPALKIGEINKMTFPSIDVIIDSIERARNVEWIEDDIEFDARQKQFGTNPQWDELLKHFNSFLFGYSGNLFRKSPELRDVFLATSIEKIDVALENVNTLRIATKSKQSPIQLTLWEALKTAIYTKSSVLNLEALQPYQEIKNARKISWYDFEGFSLPIAPLDHVKPFQQVAFQVSVIITNCNQEIEKENLVFDPKTYTSKDFIKVIKSIYREDVEKYVVYNKTYELARLKEMNKILLIEQNLDQPEFEMMLNIIIEKTVDLYDLFKTLSPKKIPGILLYDQKAKASIKNVEKHITANNINLPRKIHPYKELDVKNGAMAMEIAINRALGIIGDNEWKVREEELKKYCENDVRAMIMVYDFVEYLLKENNAN